MGDGEELRGDPVRQTTVDGVVVFWTTEKTRLTGTLMFRIGRADESLVEGGLTHLVEHLVLFGLGARQAYEFSGSVDGLHLKFHATGTAEELVAFFAHVCATIRALPVERMDDETRVLRTEAAVRSSGPVDLVLWYRYGARGHGASFYPEFGLLRRDPSALAAWVAEHFTAGNATAWFSGPIPPGLRFDLPDGPRMIGPDLLPIPHLPLPTWAHGPSGAVVMSMVGPRDDMLFIPNRIAALRIQERTRFEKGMTYNIDVGHHLLSRDLAHVFLVVTTLDEHAETVTADVLEVISALASNGPTEAELAAVAADIERQEEAPEAIPGRLDNRAFYELLGVPEKPMGVLIEEIRSMAPASVARATSDATHTALLLVPRTVKRFDPGFTPYPIHSQRAVRGRVHRSIRAPFPWSDKLPELIVGDDGVSWVDTFGNASTVMYAQLAIAIERLDESTELIGHDGFRVVVNPREWRGGNRARERIRSSIPAERLVRVVKPGGT